MVLRQLEIGKVYKVIEFDKVNEHGETLFVLDEYSSNSIYTGRLLFKYLGVEVKEIKIVKNIESYLEQFIGHDFKLIKGESNTLDSYELGDIYRTPVTKEMFKIERPISIHTGIHYIEVYLCDKYSVHMRCLDSDLDILSEFEVFYMPKYDSIDDLLDIHDNCDYTDEQDFEYREMRELELLRDFHMTISYKDDIYKNYLCKIAF